MNIHLFYNPTADIYFLSILIEIDDKAHSKIMFEEKYSMISAIDRFNDVLCFHFTAGWLLDE